MLFLPLTKYKAAPWPDTTRHRVRDVPGSVPGILV